MEAQFDIVIVGAGIMGIASAYHLKKNSPGKRVVVVDRYGAAGQGNTGRSNAMFRNTFSSSDNQILSNCSIDFYSHIQEELKVDIGLQRIGYLWLMDEAQLSISEAFLREMERNGVETRHYPREELTRLLPGMVTKFGQDADAALMGLPSIDGGVFGPKCGRLDPDKLVRYYASEFMKMGGEVLFNADVTKINVVPASELGIEGEPFVWQDHRMDGVSIRGRDQPLRAETVVLAGGAWENELLEPIGVECHAKAKKRQLFSIHAGGTRLEGLLHARGFNPLNLLPLVILPKSGVHFKPVSEEGDIWVACEDEVNRPFIDLPAHDLDEYRAEGGYYERNVYPILTSYFPDFRGSRMKAMWAGLYSYNTIDSLPFVFREKNLIVVGGDSGSGIMKGDSLGRIVDAVYREEADAMLQGGIPYKASKLSFRERDVEREEWVI